MERTPTSQSPAQVGPPARRGERYSGWPPGHLERLTDRDAFERAARERAAVSLGFAN